jgi:hypothetical protein
MVLRLLSDSAKISHGFARIFTNFNSSVIRLPPHPWPDFYLLCGRLAGGMIEFIRKYSTICP